MALEESNKRTVESLYAALGSGDTATAASVLAADLEWWFHGPPSRQHMMRMLTGKAGHEDFRFEPRNVTEVGERVVAEGWEGEGVYWVHVWTVKDGVITEVREYFNTSVTVQAVSRPGTRCPKGRQSAPTVWQSELREHLGRSLPGLLLAI